ncbi:hypothetical protein EJ08DRAFT_693759 [Tothia fuscella]|uniref:Uncharacterized protein n=1 Tax=Tothia fuscella TaxID=1048955 RepID=A0A9P4P008_9PEZI|nr:hypothetical protein EJ08DRAFT_693759 [Tothia fuscella]
MVVLQPLHSCIEASSEIGSANFTVVAADRQTLSPAVVTMHLTLHVPRPLSILVPILKTKIIAITQHATIGLYNLFPASYLIDRTQVDSPKVDILVGDFVDSFRSISVLGDECDLFNAILPRDPGA